MSSLGEGLMGTLVATILALAAAGAGSFLPMVIWPERMMVWVWVVVPAAAVVGFAAWGVLMKFRLAAPAVAAGNDAAWDGSSWMKTMSRVCVALLLSGAALAKEGAPTEAAKKDAESAVRITESLEKDPFRSDADADREWLLGWVVETPDYMVSLCDVLGPIPGDETVPNGRELLLQHMFGNVSWQIRNPGKTDLVALQVAAMESLLEVYAVFVSKDEKARIEYFDGLLAQQKKGTLEKHLAPLVNERCSGKAEEKK